MSISIPFALLDGLAGSVLRYLSPTAPLNPSRTAFLGSKLCILSPQVLLNSLSGSISAFPSPNTAPVPHSKALPGSKSPFLSPHALSRCRLLGLQVRSRSAQHSVLSRSAASRCLSSPSAPLVPPQGPAAPSLAAPHPPSGGRGAKAGLACEMASRSAGVWGGSPSLDSCPDLRTLRLAHRESFASAEPGTSSAIRRPRSESRV